MDRSALAGRLVMAGFPGTSVSAEFARQVREDGLAGIILFARNLAAPEQIRCLTGDLQALSPDGLPLLIATDQEGGVVSRLYGVAGTAFPGNMALGAAGSPDLTYAAARATGQELLSLGINFNLAPVLDVNNNPRNPVIGVRSYGEDPAKVGELGAAAVRGCQEVGVLACGKHFPGHGDTAVDSHLALPTVAHARDRLDAVELVPFRRAIAAGIGAIMTAHVVFPAVEPDPDRPATLSQRVLTGLLRQELGFAGLIITDCMEMKAIADNHGTGAAAVAAVKAGADLVLVSHTAELQRGAVAALRLAIASGEIPAARVEEALAHMEQARRRVACAAPPQFDAAEHAALGARIAAAAVTLVRDRDHILPLAPRGMGAVVCKPAALSRAEEAAAAPLCASLFRTLAPDCEVLVVDREPTPEQTAAADALAKRSTSMVVATYSAASSAAQVALVQAILAANPRTALLAQRNPYDFQALPEAGTGVVAYEDRPLMLEAAIRVLLGQQPPAGALPITL